MVYSSGVRWSYMNPDCLLGEDKKEEGKSPSHTLSQAYTARATDNSLKSIRQQ